MTRFFASFNADPPLMTGCSCGRHDSQAEHAAVTETQAAVDKLRARSEAAEFDRYSNELIEALLAQAIFPHQPTRPTFPAAIARLRHGQAPATPTSVSPGLESFDAEPQRQLHQQKEPA